MNTIIKHRALLRAYHFFTYRFQKDLNFFNAATCSFAIVLWMVSLSSFGQTCQFSVSEIAGPSNACAYTGTNGQVAMYTIVTNDAVSRKWTIPALATLISGQGTDTVYIRFRTGFKSGTLSLRVLSACSEDTVARSLKIDKVVLPPPTSVHGPKVVCDLIASGDTVNYVVDPVEGASGYRWTLPNQARLISGQGTGSIKVVFLPTFRLGNIRVRTISKCGTSGNLLVAITAKGVGRPGPIAGQTNAICGDNNVVQYSIDPVSFASSYSWSTSVPGAEIINNGVTATITFPQFSRGTVNVSASGACLVSSVRSLPVSSGVTGPDSINGPAVACEGSVQTFSVDTVEGATNYVWTVPEGSVINSGDGSPNISVTIGAVGGAISVRAATECDPGTPVNKELTVETCEPEQPQCKPLIYPIPTSGVLHVSFETKGCGSYHAYVTDIITGCVLYCHMGSYHSGKNDLCLDLTHLKDGQYIFYFKTEECSSQERIEIRH